MTISDRLRVPAGSGSDRAARTGRSRSRAGTDRLLFGLAAGTAALCLATLPAMVVLNEVLVRRAPGVADSAWDEWTSVVFGVLLLALALVVIARARRNPVGWLMLALIVLGAIEGIAGTLALVGLHVPGDHVPGAGGWASLAESLERPEFGLVFAIVLLFPTGRTPSVRWRPLLWAVAVVFPLWFVAPLLSPDDPQEPPFRGVHNTLGVGWFGDRNVVLHYAFLPGAGVLGILVVASLVARYRASTGDERQQLRWLALLAAGLPVGIVALAIASLIGDAALNAVGNVIWFFPQIGLPVAVAIAITRYRLYDLDLVVNRTVVYASLCVVLAATYGAVVLLASRLVVSAGWTSPGVVAAATLAAAAIAAPARRVIQNGVDRLFGRRAWDAERLLTAFAARWQDAPEPPAALRGVLVTALRDPGVRLGFWIRTQGAYFDTENRELAVPAPGSGRSALRIDVAGEPVALVVHDSALDRDHRLLAVVRRSSALVAQNARLQAEVLAQLAEVDASRTRIIHAADAERRRVERDLHDGAQQRLVGLAMRVKLRARTSPEPAVLDDFVDELQRATRELRELARGIHPAALSEGLHAAVESLATRTPLPVDLDLPTTRLPHPVELTAYYVAAESITNAAKHAHAEQVDVRGWISGSALHLTIQDDGCGGADLSRGTGLAGLADRVDAAGGRLEITSPTGHGTTVRAVLPCDC